MVRIPMKSPYFGFWNALWAFLASYSSPMGMTYACLVESVLTAEGTEDYIDEIRIRAITGSVKRRIEYLFQLAINQIPVQEHSTEDDVEEDIAADYAPKMDL